MKKSFFTLFLLAVCTVGVKAQGCPTPSSVNASVTFKRHIPGTIDGDFSVAAGRKVRFAEGNLQYQASTNKWRFATEQYLCISENAGNNTASGRDTQSDWIDLFGWGTSGWNNTAADATSIHYQPWESCNTNHSTTNNSYQYGPSNANVVGSTTAASAESWSKSSSYEKYDWGINMGSGWRTLTTQEWGYLINSRTNASTLRTLATVNGVKGLIIMPDGWVADGVTLTITTGGYGTNNIDLTDWGTLEEQGCVFLPAGGFRDGTDVFNGGAIGFYWSSSAYNQANAYYLYINVSYVLPQAKDLRYRGFSVRLVCNVQ